MNFMTAISSCFKKYATFSGRARRSEFWYFFLFCTVVSTALSLIFKGEVTSAIPSIFTLATLLPNLAVSWRRMHDIGKRGAWALIMLIPVVGIIIFWIWAAKNSEEGENEYGDNPKGE